MRITIIATGSRGDVQPYIGLGKGLQAAGHSVRVVSHQDFERLVSSHGLEFWSVPGNIQDFVESPEMREQVEKGNFITLMARMAKEAKTVAVHLAEIGLAACQGADLILAGIGGMFPGLAVAEKLNLPFVPAYLVPFTPTDSFSGVLTPRIPAWAGRFMNRASHHLVQQALWQGYRAADSLARKKVLGLPPAPFRGPYHSDRLHGMPVLYGISPSVMPAPSDWGSHIHVTGYWYLDAEENWTPPPALMDFLEAGPPPLYIGFGSMSNRKPEQTAELILEALAAGKQRAILTSGWGGLSKASLPDTVLMIDSAPHAWLFPRVTAVIHHGGAGTTAAGLRAGIPSIIIPFLGDQSFWGWCIAQLRVGPNPIPKKQLTAHGLAQAIHTVITDEEMRRRAACLGEQIRAENGIASAVEIIGKIDTSRSVPSSG